MKHRYINITNKILAGLLLFGITSITSCKNKEDVDVNSNAPGGEVSDMSGEKMLTDQYMVIFKNDKPGTVGQASTGGGNSPLQMEANKILKAKGVQELAAAPLANFSGAINGFVAKLSPEQIEALKNDPSVLRIEADKPIRADKGTVIGKPVKGATTTTTTTTTITTTGGTATNCITTAGSSTQPTQTVTWGVEAVGGYASGVGKTAWIFDTGIDYNHPELTVDQTRSRSFLTSSQAATYYQSPCDEYGHGTWVAGIIGAKDNTIGLVGVAAGATLVSIRVMDKNGSGYVSSVVNGINYVIANAKPGDVANFSISFGASSTMDDAIRNLAAKGVYVAIGSGNAASDCSTCSPARVDAPNVYTVSGMDYNHVFVSNANYGKPVDYCAPGQQIYTTDLNGGYKVVTGTSFAAPFAAGVLLNTGGQPKSFEFVKCDPDVYTDPIIHKHPKP